MKLRLANGFTLPEVLVTTALSTVVFAAIMSTFLMANVHVRQFSLQNIVQQHVRLAVMSLGRDLREGRDLIITRDTTGVQLQFLKTGKGIVRYEWHQSGPRSNQVIRISGQSERTVANFIEEFDVEYPDTGRVLVRIRGQMEDAQGRSFDVAYQQHIAMRSVLIQENGP